MQETVEVLTLISPAKTRRDRRRAKRALRLDARLADNRVEAARESNIAFLTRIKTRFEQM